MMNFLQRQPDSESTEPTEIDALAARLVLPRLPGALQLAKRRLRAAREASDSLRARQRAILEAFRTPNSGVLFTEIEEIEAQVAAADGAAMAARRDRAVPLAEFERDTLASLEQPTSDLRKLLASRLAALEEVAVMAQPLVNQAAREGVTIPRLISRTLEIVDHCRAIRKILNGVA